MNKRFETMKTKMSKAGHKAWITIYSKKIKMLLSKIREQSKKIGE